ncbi:MAG: hypothetical protein COB00_03955 [Alcanivorax sp.]|nr:MAG: hypothetical protein COB00_03955 [Alcanivorax sp.]
MKKASVGVVIPTYNSQATIIRALDSVVRQTLLPELVVIVDDCSTDNTLPFINNYIEKYTGEIVFKVKRLKKNGGPAVARNEGMRGIRSNYIAFLDSDDAWLSNKIEVQYKIMEKNPSCILSGHGKSVLRDDLSMEYMVPDVINPKIRKVSFQALLYRNYFSTPTVMAKNYSVRFNAKRMYSEDYFAWLKTVTRGGALYIDVPLAAIFKEAYGDSGLSARLLKMQKGEQANYYDLWRDADIGFGTFLCVSAWSWLKFSKRFLVTARK